MLRIGSTAPDFEVRLHTGLRFRLSDHAGQRNVVLYFFPRDLSARSVREGELFSGHMRELSSSEAVVLGITNAPVDRLRIFAEEHALPFPLGSDEQLEICRNYRTLWLGGKAIRRVTYVIDKRRIIRGVAHHELLIDRHWTSVRRVLAKLEEEAATAAYNRRSFDL